jgi:hypothetical protein
MQRARSRDGFAERSSQGSNFPAVAEFLTSKLPPSDAICTEPCRLPPTVPCDSGTVVGTGGTENRLQ